MNVAFQSLFAIFTHKSETSATRGGLVALQLALILGALEAIAIGSVPLEWLGHTWVIVAAVFVFPYTRRIEGPGQTAILVLAGWAVAVQIVNTMGCAASPGCGGILMPDRATTSYLGYISLRYLVLFAFIGAMTITTWLLARGHRDQIVSFIVNLGVVVAAVALYVYVAQIAGLPDIPRTRRGTDGADVTDVLFTYAFHRALGTFREPSHLAVWLLLPFFLSVTAGERIVKWRSVLIGAALLLTGSMTGIVAAVAGALGAWAFLLARNVRGALWLVKLPVIGALLVAVALIPFYFMVHGADEDAVSLWGVLWERAAPVIEYGITESNRGYGYEYAIETGIPIIGSGLGNSTIYFTQWMQLDAMAPFLSLYLNMLYSLGAIGLALTIAFLVIPLFGSLRGVHAREAWPLFAAYFAWLVIFAVHAAEVSIMFAVTYALLATLRISLARRQPQAIPVAGTVPVIR